MSEPAANSNVPPTVISFAGRSAVAGADPTLDDSLQVEINTPVRLRWEVLNADHVLLTDSMTQQTQNLAVSDGVEATVTPSHDQQDYLLFAVRGSEQSAIASTVHVSTHEAGAVVSTHGVLPAGPPPHVYTPSSIASAPASWPGVNAALNGSRIVEFDENPNSALPRWLNGEAGTDNSGAFASLQAQLQSNYSSQEFWMVLVPGTSEVAAPSGGPSHHTMYVPRPPDNPQVDVVSPEFRARLDHAYRLLQAGVVKFIIVSGGAIDLEHPEYVEAKRGRNYLIAKYANGDINSALWNQIIVEPWAVHSEMNLRNGAAIASLVGLDRLLVLTTYGGYSQGYMFEHMHGYPMNFFHSKTIDGFSDSGIGYRLGDLQKLPDTSDHLFDTDGMQVIKRTAVFIQSGFDAQRLIADPNWTIGGLELASGQLHGVNELTEAEYRQQNPGL